MENIKASFDLTTLEGQKRLFNAKNGTSISMKDLPKDNKILVSGVLQYPEITDTYGKEQEVTVTVLFDKVEGVSYASVSDSIADAGISLMNFLENTDVEEIEVRVTKGTSKGGNEFLNLQML